LILKHGALERIIKINLFSKICDSNSSYSKVQGVYHVYNQKYFKTTSFSKKKIKDKENKLET